MAKYEALKAELAGPAYQGKTDAEAADLLNAPDPGNPEPRPFDAADLMALLDAAALAKVYARPGLVALSDAVEGGRLPMVRNWLALATAAGDLSVAQRDALLAVVNATRPGASRAVQTFGVPVTAADVAHARSL